METPLSAQERIAIIDQTIHQVRQEQCRIEISLRVQKKIGETERVTELTKNIEKYEEMLDELAVARKAVRLSSATRLRQ